MEPSHQERRPMPPESGQSRSVLLIKPPYDPRIFRGGESLGLGILGALLREHGHQAEVLDPTLQNLSSFTLMQEIRRKAPDIVGLSVTCSAFFPAALKLARAVKGSSSTVHVTVGGPFPSFAFERILREAPEIDTVVRSEGEPALPVLCRYADKPECWHQVPGLAFREDGKPGGEVRIVDSPAQLQDLDTLPWPLRGRHSFGPGINDVALLSSRGCPWDCTYCIQSGFYGQTGWRGRSAENVLREMAHLRDQWRAGAFLFNDDNFLGSCPAGRKRALELAELLRTEGMAVPWAISCLPVDVDATLFGALRQAGLSQIFLGVESGVQAALDRWKKKVTTARNREAIRILRELGLGIELGFVFIDPDTTLPELEENLQFLHETQAANTAPFLNRMEVHDGMAITGRLEREGRLMERDWTYHYRVEDERVEHVHALLHQILPALGEAESAFLDIRFRSQTVAPVAGGKRAGPALKPGRPEARLKKLEKRLSDRTCQTVAEVIHFVKKGGRPQSFEEQALIDRVRNGLRQFAKEFQSSAGAS